MKSHRRSLLQFIHIALCVSALVLAFAPSAQGQQSAQVSTTSRGALRTVTFDTLEGKVIVNLPDDMMAGDTISGTVLVEPKEQESEGRSMPLELLFDFATVKVSTSGGSRQPFTIKIPASGANDKSTGRIKLTLKGEDGAYTSVRPASVGLFGVYEFEVVATGEILGQQGRPVEIPGHFDGSFENTSLRVEGQEVPLLAESPRRVIFESPRNVLGLAEIVIKESKVETKKTFRNLRIRLSAPKTTLLKGESTTLTVGVEGLQGIKEDVPLHLENASPAVVRMDGGDKQTIRITPSTLQPDGAFTATRAITGQQAGAFSVTATVVIFNHCLRDDSNGNSLVFSTFTGDYIFCHLDPKPGSSDAMVRTDGVMDFSGGVSLSTGDSLDLNKPGSGVLTFQSDDTDRRVLIKLNAGNASPSGTATIQTSNPKQTFTIRDRDTRDNTCACK